MNEADYNPFRKQAQAAKGDTKKKMMGFMVMGMIACVLAFIVTKEVVLPPMVLIGGALVAGVVLLIYGFTKPEVISYVLVAYLPFSKILPGDFGGLAMGFNFTNLLMAFIMFAWFSGKYMEGEPKWLKTPLNVPIYLFMVIALIAVVRGADRLGSGTFVFVFAEFKRWVTPIFLYFLVLNTVKTRAMIKNMVITMIIVTTLVGLMAIYDYISLGAVGDMEKARIGGICEHSNSLAAFFNYYMFLPYGFFLMNMKKPKYWLLLLPFLIQFRGIMVTFSRGGYLAFGLGLVVVSFLRSKWMLLAMVGVILIAMMNPVILPAGVRYRLSQTFEKKVSNQSSEAELEGALESSAQTRVQVWKGAVEMIKDHPILGVGYDMFLYQIEFYWVQRRPIDAHNTYLIIAAEMGIPALLVFLWLIMIVMWNTFMLYRTTQDPFAKATALGFLGGLFGLLMSNMFGSRLDSQEVSSYFWILAAMTMRLKILDQREARLPKPETPQGEKPKDYSHLPWFERPNFS